jgi:ABC-2 type transport system ATP-binding protein
MTQSNEIVLSVQNLKKRIRDKEIIKGISFEVYGGEIFGFLGPNGSGKTTTIRMLVGLIKPTEGTVVVCGHDIRKEHNEALRHVGCIVENPELYSYLTGWENLEYFARMLPDVGEDRIHEVVELVGLDQRIHDKVKTYSLGMRQRLGIAQALLGRPKLLILDEPTNGLDPKGIKEMREFIRKLAEGGLSLFVSSHLLSEIQQMCDRVAIISHGQVVQVGEVDELVSSAETKVIWSVEPAAQAAEILAASPDVQLIAEMTEDGTEYPIQNQQEEKVYIHQADMKSSFVTHVHADDIPKVNEALVKSGVKIFSIETIVPTLEDLFLGLTGGERIE